ncbi:helicase HerA domain-containing protein [Rhizobium sp. L1K21]|uniref:ATP-binding protein n=1 Tax=Rhizobium sp. L1K21 TaxID=2954933 RepID=UPI003593E0EC
MGRVVACSGSRATIAAIAEHGATDMTELWSVGRLISISVDKNRVVALVNAMHTENDGWQAEADNNFHIEVELLGEVRVNDDGSEEFSTGISHYPYLGAIAHRIRSADLRRVYDTGRENNCAIGALTQDTSIEAAIHIPSMLSKHFAVVGSTGVGKSTAVSLLLRKSVAVDPRLRVLILDPHNEFAAAFPDLAIVVDTETLDLPFWLMRLEEFAEVVYRGRPAVAEELDFLRDMIPEAKRAFRGESAFMRRQSEKSAVTADTPVPYRISDLLALIDDRIGKLEGRNEKPFLRSLKLRIMAAVNDPRYHFMFSSNTISDNIMETIQTIFRIPGDGKPITTFQLSGIPSEVVNSVASVLTRMAFEIGLWSNGAIHMLVVCEEAHRYVPADPNLGFFPTRHAIARIAKEGRKYGVSLGIITQRPGELDQTILSQCSTVFAMRLANERDQEIIRSAIPNSSTSTMSFISSIGNGEAIAFGEAVAVPMRMRFERVAPQRLPKAQMVTNGKETDEFDSIDLRTIVSRMRAVGTEPDISDFQNRYESSIADRGEEDGATRPERASDLPRYEETHISPVRQQQSSVALEFERPAATPQPHRSENLEAYRRDMLPGASRPAEPAASQSPYSRVERAIVSDQPPAARIPTDPQREPASIRREPGMSLRESILKRPLSSLKKDGF